jgi:hypothetical protein
MEMKVEAKPVQEILGNVVLLVNSTHFLACFIFLVY